MNMNTDPSNPYQPPNINPNFQKQKPAAETSLASVLFSFSGRIPRRTYWGVSLSMMVIFYAAIFGSAMIFGENSIVLLVILGVAYIPLIWISLAIQVKRWHDLGKSGWWILIGFVPCIGPIWALIETGFLRGTVGPNEYGSDPT
ncbi:MAG: uncharacterized membrane protein YhaH (DUF805 family) [Mariniblastus sp.]|jgi:uncharacterized membrane protein YhaH (DUF805 family)